MNSARGFHHAALFYAGMEDYLAQTVPFIREGVDAGEAVMVAVDAKKTRLIRSALDGQAGTVQFVDMAALGRNPACIIPAWREFVSANVAADRAMRGIGEPVWPGRTPEELVECDHHESLLNLAFDDGPPWQLVCPYDTDRLDEQTLQAARRNHPTLAVCGSERTSNAYVDPRRRPGPFADPLPPASPDGDVAEVAFTDYDLLAVRRFVADAARRAGLDAIRADDLVLAVNELTTNSLRHGGGRGSVALWRENGALVCEIRDEGRITYPLAGRVLPANDAPGGRGLWLVNHLCDLVQIRSRPDGNVVRLRMTT